MSTDDRKLLELAAKAAGIAALPNMQDPHVSSLRVFGGYWNPLADDGDALRLAVKLGLLVDCSRAYVALPFTWHKHNLPECVNDAAATRRAIVRAAAAIGEQMP